MAERLGTQLQSGGLEQSINSGLIGSGLFGGASLDLNFAATKNLGPLVTFTRASSATYVGSDGLIKTATTNEPRFDHNPTTGESLGLLVEEQRTNLALNSATFQPTSGAAPASYTVDQVAPDGTTTGSRQTAATPRTLIDYTGIANALYTFSFYCRVTSGTASFSIQLKDAVTDTIIVSDTTPVATTTWRRFSISGTTTGATTGARIELTGIVPGFVFWGAQLEAGAFPTSYIPTTTAAATRSADVASITGSAFSSWYRQDEGTVFARYSFPRSPNTGGARVFVFSNSAGTNLIWLRAQGGVNRIYDVTDASVSQATFNQGAYAAGVEYRAALATKANNFGFAENGGAPQSDSSGTVPSEASAETDSLLLEDSPFNDFYILGYGEASSSGVGVDRLGIGVDASGTAPGNVHIRRLTYWPQRLPNSTLVALTQ
jgi:hypothetical protein